MFKILIIFFLVIYVVFRLGGFIIRMLFSGFSNQQRQTSQSGQRPQQYRKPSDGNVNIDYMPKDKKQRPQGDIKGGDYVDYEEVK